jgi:hypothetical protein
MSQAYSHGATPSPGRGRARIARARLQPCRTSLVLGSALAAEGRSPRRSAQRYSGQAAPPSIHVRIAAAVSSRDNGGNVLPSPGFQPQPTRSSCAT